MVEVHSCSVCKKSKYWSNSWVWYGSDMMVDTIPDDIPKLCSDLCREAFQDGLDSGEITMRNVQTHGYGYTITGRRKGY